MHFQDRFKSGRLRGCLSLASSSASATPATRSKARQRKRKRGSRARGNGGHSPHLLSKPTESLPHSVFGSRSIQSLRRTNYALLKQGRMLPASGMLRMPPSPTNRECLRRSCRSPTKPTPKSRRQKARAKTMGGGVCGANSWGAESRAFLSFPLPVPEEPSGPRNEEKDNEEPVGHREP